ncbi:MAG: hypothetical protein HYZ50_22620 [Deltaproteobacteria bacterium]|nr:hypothetical protein [Deltaproteobacteria bacterium]
MFPILPLTGVAQHVLDVTTGFTPLFLGLIAVLGVSFLGLAFSIRKEWTSQQAASQPSHTREELSIFPKAA